jgi:GDP/UDP-N,N'-diacetylbacillosamine 2-epimerase (hydrolysing)
MRKICVVTSSRAEYGLLYWLLKAIQADPKLELQLAVTGMHLSPLYGSTASVIEQDGFRIDARVEMLLASDTPVGIAKSIGVGTIGFAEAFERLQPDIVVILGDRFEMLAPAQAAMVARIPIAHLYGGEATEGMIDEAVRHAITKMSHLHFTSHDEYRRRVIQLGEDPSRVFNVGAIGIDSIRRLRLLNREEFESSINFKLGNRNLLITFHPVTLDEKGSAKLQFTELLAALDDLEDVKMIFTKPNADTDGHELFEMIDEYVGRKPSQRIAFTSLGQTRYLSAMQFVDGVIGNSSSGLIEVPSFHIGTINIGDRQRGRVRAASVIECDPTKAAIAKALKKLFSESFRKSLLTVVSPYGEGGVAEKITQVLASASLEGILKKRFYNVQMHSNQMAGGNNAD